MLLFCEKHILKTKSSRFVIWASGRFWTTFECSDRFPMQQRRFVSVKRDATVTSETVKCPEVDPDGGRFLTVERASLWNYLKIINVSPLRYALCKLLRQLLGDPSSNSNSSFKLTKKRWTPRAPDRNMSFREVPKNRLRVATPISSWHFCDFVGGALLRILL